MRHKKGIELSINFLVIVIISLAVLGMSVILFNKFFKGAHKIQTDYDKQTEEELEALLVAGKKVAIPFTRKEVKAGETGVFGLGILNVLGSKKDFYIYVECSSLIKPDGTPQSCNLNYLVSNPQTIENNDDVKIPIAIPTQKTTPVGTYIFNVCVCPDTPCTGCTSTTTNLYDENLHKLYLKVT